MRCRAVPQVLVRYLRLDGGGMDVSGTGLETQNYREAAEKVLGNQNPIHFG